MPQLPVLRLVIVRVLQSSVGVLIVLIGGAGVPVVAAAMIAAGLALGVWQMRRWTDAHAHPAITGLVLAGATAAHTLAVLNAPVASVETIVLAGALFPLAADRASRRRPQVIAMVVACIATGGLFVGFAGGSALGVGLAIVSAACAALLVMRLEQRPPVLSPARYQALSITLGGFALLPFGLLLGDATSTIDTALVLVVLAAIFAITNLELARVLPSTGAVVGMSSTGARPITALLLSALVLDETITASALVLAVAYVVALAALVQVTQAQRRMQPA